MIDLNVLNKSNAVETIELPDDILSIEAFKFDNNTDNVKFNKLALLVKHSEGNKEDN